MSSAAMAGTAVDASKSAPNGDIFMGRNSINIVVTSVHNKLRIVGQMNFVAFCRNKAIPL